MRCGQLFTPLFIRLVRRHFPLYIEGLSLYNLKMCLLVSGVERRRHLSHWPACQADVRSAPARLSPQIFGDAAVATGLTGDSGGPFATEFDKNIQEYSVNACESRFASKDREA